MTGYERYAIDVENGSIIVGRYIKLLVQRYRDFQKRTDMYFDADKVQEVIDFVHLIKHFKGKHAGEYFILEPWQEFAVAMLFGFKWKSDNTRVTRQFFLLVSRKAGKSAFAAAINLYLMIADGEASPEQVFVANSREQARLLFETTTEFAKSIDPMQKNLKPYRNKISFKSNLGIIKVLSSDSSKLDGLNLSSFTLDEYHEQKDRRLIDVLISSMGMREQPMQIIITTAGFNLHSPCHDLYELSIQILEGLKSDDSLCPMLYMLDEDDKWDDPDVWAKSNPNMGVTITKEFIEGEILKAKNDPSAEVGVRTKTLNQWCQSSEVWLPNEMVAKNMKDLKIEDFYGNPCIVGIDLASVNDLTAVSLLFYKDEKFWFFNRAYLPLMSIEEHPNRELYRKFIRQKDLVATHGNVTDYQYIVEDLIGISEHCPILSIHYDKYNATQFAIQMTELGYNMQPFAQGLASFNGPTKEFSRRMAQGDIIIDNSEMVLWEFANVVLVHDHADNQKPDKDIYANKIDNIIAMIQALGGYLQKPINDDFDIMIL